MLNYDKIKEYLPNNLSDKIINQINALNFLPVKPRYNIAGKKFNRLIALGKGPNIITANKTYG